MKKIYIYTGLGKDEDGACRRAITAIAEGSGASVTDEISESEAIVALGGDGTMLHASLCAVKYGLPIIGVNLGFVGYMTELDRGETDILKRLFSDEYRIEERMALSVIPPDGHEYLTLNDAVIHSKGTHMLSIRLTCEGADVGLYRGDGVIFATPTGSTAYSMSAGGSIIDPNLKCICVTPVCPQSPIAKPMVFSPERELTAEVQDECTITPDGGDPISLISGDKVTVKRHPSPVKLIKLKDNEFFSVLRSKLDLLSLKRS